MVHTEYYNTLEHTDNKYSNQKVNGNNFKKEIVRVIIEKLKLNYGLLEGEISQISA